MKNDDEILDTWHKQKLEYDRKVRCGKSFTFPIDEIDGFALTNTVQILYNKNTGTISISTDRFNYRSFQTSPTQHGKINCHDKKCIDKYRKSIIDYHKNNKIENSTAVDIPDELIDEINSRIQAE